MLIILVIGFFGSQAFADNLPYSTRTHAYSGWNSSVEGDVRTVGMSGATVGLPDTFLAASDNPSGLAMLMKDADDNFTSNTIKDQNVQSNDNPINTSSLGLAVAIYPWAFSLGYVTPSREGGPYYLLNGAGYGNVTVTTREFRLGVSRVFDDNKFSLGVSLNLGQSEEEVEVEVLQGADQTQVQHNYTMGATLGTLYQLPRHFLLGASFVTPRTYNVSQSGSGPTPINGFYQPVIVPARIGVGLGWVPNYYARMDFSLFGIATTQGAALLKDDQSLVGQHATLQPRAGIAYIFADYPEFRGTVYGGSYYEMTRIENTSSRIHATSGVEVKAWLFTLGLGGDLSSGYTNVITSVGLDLVKALIKLDIVPKPYNPPAKGFFPDPTRIRDDGLPRPLVKNWKPQGPDMNPIKIIEKIPEKISEKIEGKKEEKTPAPKQRPKKKPKQKKKQLKKKTLDPTAAG